MYIFGFIYVALCVSCTAYYFAGVGVGVVVGNVLWRFYMLEPTNTKWPQHIICMNPFAAYDYFTYEYICIYTMCNADFIGIDLCILDEKKSIYQSVNLTCCICI